MAWVPRLCSSGTKRHKMLLQLRNAVLLKLSVATSGPALITAQRVECLNTTQICFQRSQNVTPLLPSIVPLQINTRAEVCGHARPCLPCLCKHAMQLLPILNILAGVLSGGESCTFACRQGCETERQRMHVLASALSFHTKALTQAPLIRSASNSFVGGFWGG